MIYNLGIILVRNEKIFWNFKMFLKDKNELYRLKDRWFWIKKKKNLCIKVILRKLKDEELN